MSEEFDPREIDSMIDKYISGELSEDEADVLCRLLDTDAPLRKRLGDNLRIDQYLQEIPRFGDIEHFIFYNRLLPMFPDHSQLPAETRRYDRRPAETKQVTGRFRRALRLSGFLTLIVCIVFLAYQVIGPRPASKPEEFETTLIGQSDPVWREAPEAKNVGLILTSKVLRLQSGHVAVRLPNRIDTTLSGMTELKFESSQSVQCVFGQASFDIPKLRPGETFCVKLPQATVVVHGTAFTVKSHPSVSEVHVREGVVTVEASGGGEPIRLEAGQAYSISSTGDGQLFTGDPDLFVEAASLKSQPFTELKKWEEQGRRIDDDPSLLVRFNFERKPMMNLPNQSKAGVKEIPFGMSHRFLWTEGRMLGKWGISPQTRNDSLSVELFRERKQCAFVLWMRLDALEAQPAELLSCKSFSWCIDEDGQLVLTIGEKKRPATPPFWQPDQLGQWTQLVLNVDLEADTASHYVDGRLVRVNGINDLKEFFLDTLTIGPFNGAVDEFLFFDRVLTVDEINGMK